MLVSELIKLTFCISKSISKNCSFSRKNNHEKPRENNIMILYYCELRIKKFYIIPVINNAFAANA